MMNVTTLTMVSTVILSLCLDTPMHTRCMHKSAIGRFNSRGFLSPAAAPNYTVVLRRLRASKWVMPTISANMIRASATVMSLRDRYVKIASMINLLSVGRRDKEGGVVLLACLVGGTQEGEHDVVEREHGTRLARLAPLHEEEGAVVGEDTQDGTHRNNSLSFMCTCRVAYTDTPIPLYRE